MSYIPASVIPHARAHPADPDQVAMAEPTVVAGRSFVEIGAIMLGGLAIAGTLAAAFLPLTRSNTKKAIAAKSSTGPRGRKT